MTKPTIWLILGITLTLLGLAMMNGWFDWILHAGGIALTLLGIAAMIYGAAKGLSGARRKPGAY